ncbi:MAG: hypothetical protein ACRDQ0_08415, partial [Pseudonocardia sp.]
AGAARPRGGEAPPPTPASALPDFLDRVGRIPVDLARGERMCGVVAGPHVPDVDRAVIPLHTTRDHASWTRLVRVWTELAASVTARVGGTEHRALLPTDPASIRTVSDGFGIPMSTLHYW